jgi:transposase
MLIGSSRVVRVFASPEPVDLRLGFDGLFALARDALQQDPMSGDLYLYVNRPRTRCKVLFWDGTGLCIFQKRLARGRFANLFARTEERTATITLTASELALFIEGASRVVAASPRALSPQNVIAKSAGS